MCRRGAITDEDLRDEKDRLVIQRSGLEMQLMKVQEQFVSIDTVLNMAVDFMANAAKLWEVAEGDNRVGFQRMAIPGGLTVKQNMKFGTAEISAVFRAAHLLEAKLEGSKKTQNDSESVLVTSRGISQQS